jgi:hypothetical protein
MALRSTLLMTRDPSKCLVDGVAKQVTTALEISPADRARDVRDTPCNGGATAAAAAGDAQCNGVTHRGRYQS